MQLPLTQMLEHLLVKRDFLPISRSCLDALQSEESCVSLSANNIPRLDVVSIYRRRAQINAQNGSTVVGYETLLPTLRNSGLEDVTITLLETRNTWYAIFTDVNMSELLGILEGRHVASAAA